MTRLAQWFSSPRLAKSQITTIAVLWLGAALLSTTQVYWRHSLSGGSPRWSETLTANLVAWLPWLVLVPLALSIERRFPLTGTLPIAWRARVLHALLAGLVATVFVAYLTAFRVGYLGDVGFDGSSDTLLATYKEEAAAHFLAAALLYAAIVSTSTIVRVFRERAQGPPAEVPPSPDRPRGLLVNRSVGRVELIEPETIDWVETAGSYVTLHLSERSILLRRTLASLEAELEERRFLRIHRFTLVNLRRIEQLQPASHGEAWVVLAGGKRLKVSRTYRRQLRDRLA